MSKCNFPTDLLIPKALSLACVVQLLLSYGSAAFAHDPDAQSPRWCNPVSEGRAQGDEKIGEFPGPKEHFRMNNQPLGEFAMAKEFPGFLGRDFRVRFWLMEPGGLIAEHCHEDRPAFVYILSGEVIETIMEADGEVKTDKKGEGQAVPEGNGTRHWWKNNGKINVEMVAIDFPNKNVLPPQGALKNVVDDGVTPKDLAEMDMQAQYPHISAMSGYKLTGQLLTVKKGGSVGLRHHYSHPGMAYVVNGTLLEYRSDSGDKPIVRRKNDLSLTHDGLWNYWRNRGHGEAKLLIIKFEKDGG